MITKCIYHYCLVLIALVCLICLLYDGLRASGRLYCVLRVSYTYTPSCVARTGFHWRDDNFLQTLMLTFCTRMLIWCFLIISDNLGSFLLVFLGFLLWWFCVRCVKVFLWLVVDVALFLTTLVDRVARFCRYSKLFIF